jgi:hypothetical protein
MPFIRIQVDERDAENIMCDLDEIFPHLTISCVDDETDGKTALLREMTFLRKEMELKRIRDERSNKLSQDIALDMVNLFQKYSYRSPVLPESPESIAEPCCPDLRRECCRTLQSLGRPRCSLYMPESPPALHPECCRTPTIVRPRCSRF